MGAGSPVFSWDKAADYGFKIGTSDTLRSGLDAGYRRKLSLGASCSTCGRGQGVHFQDAIGQVDPADAGSVPDCDQPRRLWGELYEADRVAPSSCSDTTQVYEPMEATNTASWEDDCNWPGCRWPILHKSSKGVPLRFLPRIGTRVVWCYHQATSSFSYSLFDAEWMAGNGFGCFGSHQGRRADDAGLPRRWYRRIQVIHPFCFTHAFGPTGLR